MEIQWLILWFVISGLIISSFVNKYVLYVLLSDLIL